MRHECSSIARLLVADWIGIGSDGLHLTSEGYAVLFKAVSGLILATYPELNPETMPMRMPQ